MSDGKKHALMSPSSAYRWMVCPGSVPLGARFPKKSSAYADEGTEAHDHAAHYLLKRKFKKDITPEMHRDLEEYIEYVLQAAKGHSLMVEQALPLTWLTGEEDAEGTSDSVIITLDGETLIVVDLKYGAGVKVYVYNNEQLMIYALAALKQFEMMGDFKKVKMVIHQPRMDHVDEWEVDVGTLMEFAGSVKLAAIEVRKAMKSNSLEGFLHAGEKQCRFCPAAGNCPALAQLVVDETGCQFENVEEKLPVPADPHRALLHVDQIEAWCKATRAAVEADLLAGRGSEFWALEEGKKGNRKWQDEKATEATMKKLKLTPVEMYGEPCIQSPAQAEKALKKKKPGAWEALMKLYSQKKGPPSVVHKKDLKEPYEPVNAEDFDNVEAA